MNVTYTTQDKNDIIGFKENIPPQDKHPEQAEHGIMGNLGAYEEKRKRLQEQRKKEYNNLIAEVC